MLYTVQYRVPDVGGPDVGGPDVGGPDVGGPDVGGPDVPHSSQAMLFSCVELKLSD